MSDKHLSRSPKNLIDRSSPRQGSAWFYEEPKGLCVVVEQHDREGKYVGQTSQYYISWARIRSALKRKDR